MSGTQAVNETLYAKKPYHLMKDLVPVAPLIDTDLVLVVSPNVPAHNLKELIALARGKTRHAQLRLVGPGLELSHGRRAPEDTSPASTSSHVPL